MSSETRSDVEVVPFGAPMAGGFYAGRILVAGIAYALILPPKAVGDHAEIELHDIFESVDGAMSCNDGLANTLAMAEAGSALAKWALGLKVDGNTGFYLPSQDELEICYRNLKPGTEENTHWLRSGINVSAVPPTYPYACDLPVQTTSPLFQSGGAEAFEEKEYWSSTHHVAYTDSVWCQLFSNGTQHCWNKDQRYRARAVRRLKL